MDRIFKHKIKPFGIYEHAKVASVFILAQKQSALTKQLKRLFSMKSIEPVECLQKWQTLYQAWHEQKT